MRGIVVAISPEGVIGLSGKLPWHYKGDLQRFKRLTMGSAIIMGRRTWESIGRPLPGRRNVVIASRDVPGVETYRDLPSALAAIGPSADAWFIGGARVYEEAMRYADLLDVTYVPDHVLDPEAVKFPPIDERVWAAGQLVPHEDEPALSRRVYMRREDGTAGSRT